METFMETLVETFMETLVGTFIENKNIIQILPFYFFSVPFILGAIGNLFEKALQFLLVLTYLDDRACCTIQRSQKIYIN